jgi:uncharacterized protein (DUF924 family)
VPAPSSPEEVLRFWFGEPLVEPGELQGRIDRWFQGGTEVDREIVQRFAGAVEVAVAGGLEEWRPSPRGRLALVLLLDQFTRNVFRDSPRMYAGDARAQTLALESFDDGSARALAWVERLFLSLPLLHAEDLALQKREGEIAAALAAEVPALYRPMAPMLLEQSGKYTHILERFGRFPHRNAILGRVSTAEEMAFLSDWLEKAPPSGSRPATGR